MLLVISINMVRMAVIFPRPGSAFVPVTSVAGGDTRLSALVNSQSCEGQELTYNEAWQCWRVIQGSAVNSGPSVVMSRAGWGFNSSHSGNLSTVYWSRGLCCLLTHIRAWTQNKLASVNILSLLLPPDTATQELTSSQNNRHTSDCDGKRLHSLMMFLRLWEEKSHFSLCVTVVCTVWLEANQIHICISGNHFTQIVRLFPFFILQTSHAKYVVQAIQAVQRKKRCNDGLLCC